MKKNIIKSIALMLVAGLMLSTAFLLQKNIGSTRAATHYENNSAVDYYDRDFGAVSTHIQKDIIIDRIVMESGQGNFAHTYYLYPEGETTESIENLFSIYKEEGQDITTHINGGGLYDDDVEKGSNQLSVYSNQATNSDNVNTQITSVTKLANNIIIAMREGYVSAGAKAEYSSKRHYYYRIGLVNNKEKDKDGLEGTQMKFFAYNSADNPKTNNVFRESAIEHTENFASKSDFNFSSSELKGLGADRLEIVFYSFFQEPSSGRWDTGVLSSNFIQIQNPALSLETSDTALPSMSLSGTADEIASERERWTRERTINLNCLDSESGVYRVEVSRDGSEFEVLKDFNEADLTYKTSANTTYTISENGDYYFRVVDNVGNISSVCHYEEKYIDQTAPIVNVDESVNGLYLSKTISFNANFVSDGLSEEYYTYSVLLNGKVVSGLNNLTLNEVNTFDVTDFGVYSLKVDATDFAGNSAESQYFTLILPDFGVQDFYTTNEIFYNADVSSNGLDAYEFYFNVSKADGGTSFGEHQVSKNNAENKFSLSETGKYTLKFDFFARSGETVYAGGSKNVDVDYTVYTLTTSAENGTISDGISTNRSIQTITFSPNEGYELYTLTVKNSTQTTVYCVKDLNGSLKVGQTSFSLDLDDNYEVSVKFRKIVKVTLNKTQFIYNYGSFNLVYAEDYEAEVAENLITFKFLTEGGEEVSGANFVVGKYTVSFLIDTDEFSGSGSYEIEILKKTLKVSGLKTVYNFSESGTNFVFECDDRELAGVKVNFFVGGEAQNFNSAGFYTFEIVAENPNFEIESLSENVAVILPNILNVEKTEAEYNGSEHTIEFSSTGEGFGKIELKFFAGEEQCSSVNAGSYAVKFVFVQGENEMEIPYSSTTLVVAKKQLVVSVKVEGKVLTSIENTYAHTYDKLIPEISYVADGFVAGESVSFELEYNISCNASKEPYAVSIKKSDASILSNYEVSYICGFVQIVPRTLYVVSESGLSKEYHAEDPTTFGYQITGGLLDGDENAFSLTLKRESGENAGLYDIVVDEFSSENYKLSFTSTKFQITKRFAIITILDMTKEYDGEAEGERFDFIKTNSNVLESDYETIISLITREVGKDVGTYKIYLDESQLINYQIITKNATLTIVKKHLKVSADNKNALYGDNLELTFSVSDERFKDKLVGSLEREQGDDAKATPYKILQGTVTNENNPNFDIEFESGNYTISKRAVTVTPDSGLFSSYGEVESLTYKVYFEGDVFECELAGSLSRTGDKNVGTYEITLGDLAEQNPNFIITFTSGVTFEVKRAKISVEINNQTKAYGESDGEFTYTVFGLVDDDEILLDVVRDEGESVGGEYLIHLSESQSKFVGNYEIETVSEAYLSIVKADLKIELKDETVTYNGAEQHISLDLSKYNLDESKLKVKYVCGSKTSPIDAGEYFVQVIFEGDENYNAFESNTALLTILQKQISITFTELDFIYDGTEKFPKFFVNTEGVDLGEIGVYFDKKPIEPGSYKFTLEILSSAKTNYKIRESDESYVLNIYDAYTNSNSNASLSTGNVSFAGSNLEFVELNNPSLKSKFSSSANSRRCVSVYGFKNIEGLENSKDIVTVSIKALSRGKDVMLYILDSEGNLTPINFELKDGYYILSISDLSANILVTVVDKSSNYLKAGIFVLVLFITYLATKNIKKRKREKFFVKNTSKIVISAKDFANNKDIVKLSVIDDEVISLSDFLKE